MGGHARAGPQKITFADMRAQSVAWAVDLHCSDYRRCRLYEEGGKSD
jgi:hypothetical protein